MSDFNPAFKDAQPVAEKKGMSGCVKALIIVAIVGVVGCLACCVTGGLWLRNAQISDPQKVIALSDKILTWDRPEITPVGGMDIVLMRVAIFSNDQNGTIFLADSPYIPADDLQRSFEGQFSGGMEFDDEQTTIVKHDTRQFTIKGQPVTFQFNESTGVSSGTSFWEIIGAFQGNDNPTFLLLRLPQDAYPLERVEEIMKSIR